MLAMRKYEQIIPNTLPRTSSCKSTSKIIPANHIRSSSSSLNLEQSEEFRNRPIIRRGFASTTLTFHRIKKTGSGVSNFLRSLFSFFTFPSILPACRWLTVPTQLSITPSLGRKVTGTLFELAISTAALLKEMSSGLVRIALECEKAGPSLRRGGERAGKKLFGEPFWTMYCSGRQCGIAQSRACTKSDWHVLSTVQSVSVGAGVIPVVDDGMKGSTSEGELLYMRARFERVVGNRDSEAFYMLNPDGNGGPEFSIFLLRI
ncbi:hypothetical protein CDL12_26536 [Handroanthus impetiginosus]|uniref:Protein MIZU-KUSSEI 1 n=1 Tax=Handroanthus impetiginosus TaxID=429701 RepID=A0A2G9G6M5_9LAMI|nr:hypothetical protein CDL12_26536 [Handroanthus impetiginosus]